MKDIVDLVPEVPMACPDCEGTLRRRYVKKYGKHQYICDRGCRAAIGCHPNGAVLGIPGNRETRLARMRAHAAFDAIWKSGAMPRAKAYGWLSKQMGLERIHIAELDVAGCRRVIEIALAYKPETP